MPGAVNPAPWDYDPVLVPAKTNVANASFKQPSYLRRYQVNLYDPHAPIEQPKYPGPTQYNTEVVNESQLNPVNQSMFSSTGNDRFGKQFRSKVGRKRPAPGDYEYSFREEETLPVSGAVFMSETDRQILKVAKKPPGPAYYSIKQKPKKKSFHLNSTRTWL
jgi:hypothetical protein